MSIRTSKVKTITDDVKRAKLKTSATYRAQFNWEIAMKRIDFRIDVIDPAVKQVELDAAKGELPEFSVVEE